MGSWTDILKNGVSSSIDGVINKNFAPNSSNNQPAQIDRIPPMLANPITPLPSNTTQNMIDGVDNKLIYIGGAILLSIVLVKSI